MITCEETFCQHSQVAICLHCTKKLCIHHIEHHQKALLTQLDQIKDRINHLKITINNASNTMIEQRKADEEKSLKWRQEKLAEIDREYNQMIGPIRDRQKILEHHESSLHQRLEVEVEQPLEEMLREGNISYELLDVIQSTIQIIEKESVLLKWKAEESTSADECNTSSKDERKSNSSTSSKRERRKQKKMKKWKPRNLLIIHFRNVGPKSAVELQNSVQSKLLGEDKMERSGLITLIFSYLCTWHKTKADKGKHKQLILNTHILTIKPYITGNGCQRKVLMALEYFFDTLKFKDSAESTEAVEMMTMLLELFFDHQYISMSEILDWYSNKHVDDKLITPKNKKTWAEPFLIAHRHSITVTDTSTTNELIDSTSSLSDTPPVQIKERATPTTMTYVTCPRIRRLYKKLIKHFRNQSNENNVLALEYFQRCFTNRINNRVIMAVRSYLMIWDECASSARNAYLLQKISLIKYFKDDPDFEFQLIYAIELFFTTKKRTRKWSSQSISTLRQFFLDQGCLTEETISRWDSEGPFYDETHYQEIKTLNRPFLEPWNVCAYKTDDDISIVHQRVLNWMLLPSEENITAIVQDATTYYQTLNSSCYWADIIYDDTRLTHWRTIEHLYRITTMLQAITVNNSKIQNDPSIRSAVHCALNVWLVNDWQALNWFHNEINVPTFVTGQLLMLGENATSFEIEKIKEISFRSAWWLNRPRDVGANLVWMLQIQLYRSFATNNITGIEQGFTRMWEDIAIQSANGEGIQHDWSYHFHGTQLLSGAYGQAWAQTIFAFATCTQQTGYAPNDQQVSTFVQFITKGSAWMIIGQNWEWHVMGRAVSRPDDEYHVLFYTKFIRAVAQFVEMNDTKVQLLSFADRLDGQVNASSLIGNRHFFVSDYQVHRRPNWTSAIKMQSIRTQPIECINVEDQKGEHSGQGVLNLYTGNTYDYKDIFPLLDWQAINGITVEHDIPLEPCKNGVFAWQNRAFVGGVSDDQYGLALMDTASHNLTARRSWHFYDDAIVALATNLTLTTPTTAWTTLASRLLPIGKITIGFFNSSVITLSDGDYSFPYLQDKTANVQWIHVGNSDIGYLLQSQQQYVSLGVEVGFKTGNYLDIGSFNSSVSARVLTIWINHGLGPNTLDYNYMILPNVSLQSIPALIQQYNDEQVFSCLSTNGHFHGIVWPTLKRASFVLWDNITTRFSCKSPSFEINIELSNAGAYLYSETATDFIVTASHPMRLSDDVKVTVNRMGSGEGCATFSKDDVKRTEVTLRLPVSRDLLGSSVNIRCKILTSGAILYSLPFVLLSFCLFILVHI